MFKNKLASKFMLGCLCIAGLVGCSISNQAPLPSEYSILFQESAGMLQQETAIFLSNTEQSFVHFNSDGVKNKIPIYPESKELDALLSYMMTQQFKKIKTKTVEALDRGGNSITVNFGKEKIRVSNMGFSFVKNRWINPYVNIANRINTIAQNNLSDQLSKVDVELDASLFRPNWQTNFTINPGVFIEHTERSDQPNSNRLFTIPVIRGENFLAININDTGIAKPTSILNWSDEILVSPDLRKITIKLADEKIKVIYNNQEFEGTASMNNQQPEIVETQNLNSFSSSSILDIDLKIDKEDIETEYFDLAIHYRDKKNNIDIPLLQTYGSLKDSYADIHYTLYNTGNSAYPFLLFYSGQAGDEYNIPGAIILFDRERKIGSLTLNDGNRIYGELIEVLPNMIKVKEAIMCHQSIYTTIAYSENGLERLEGFFPVNTSYPNNEEIPEPSHKSAYTLKNNLEVMLDGKSKVYTMGQSITIVPEWVDFDLQVIFLKINEDKVSMPLKKYKMNQFVQSMYAAKCEMG